MSRCLRELRPQLWYKVPGFDAPQGISSQSDEEVTRYYIIRLLESSCAIFGTVIVTLSHMTGSAGTQQRLGQTPEGRERSFDTFRRGTGTRPMQFSSLPCPGRNQPSTGTHPHPLAHHHGPKARESTTSAAMSDTTKHTTNTSHKTTTLSILFNFFSLSFASHCIFASSFSVSTPVYS